MSRRTGVHKVGLTAATLGLLALFALPFATFRTSRIQTGDELSALASLGPVWLLAIAFVWLALAAASLRDDRRALPATLRGAAATVALVGTVLLCGVAAQRLLAHAGPFARVSIGAGAWANAIAAYMALLAARREVGPSTPLGITLTAAAPVAIVAILASGFLSDLGMAKEYANTKDRFWTEVAAQLTFSAAAMAIAVVVGIALGVLAYARPGFRGPIFTTVSVFQTIPGLAMIGLLFAPLAWLGANVPLMHQLGVGGLGWAPVVTSLTLYALLAVVRNTYTGLAGVPHDAVDAGRGMGMTGGQVMRRVRFPLATPVLFGGVRTSTIQTVGNATLGAFVAAGTLGLFIFGGLSQQATDLIMLGSVALVALALAIDAVLRVVQRLVSPRQGRSQTGGGA